MNLLTLDLAHAVQGDRLREAETARRRAHATGRHQTRPGARPRWAQLRTDNTERHQR
jgi:hypothetical protein